MYYPSSENKGADQLRGFCEADLHLCFRLCRLLVFPCGGSIMSIVFNKHMKSCLICCLLIIQIMRSFIYTAPNIYTETFSDYSVLKKVGLFYVSWTMFAIVLKVQLIFVFPVFKYLIADILKTFVEFAEKLCQIYIIIIIDKNKSRVILCKNCPVFVLNYSGILRMSMKNSPQKQSGHPKL